MPVNSLVVWKIVFCPEHDELVHSCEVRRVAPVDFEASAISERIEVLHGQCTASVSITLHANMHTSCISGRSPRIVEVDYARTRHDVLTTYGRRGGSRNVRPRCVTHRTSKKSVRRYAEALFRNPSAEKNTGDPNLPHPYPASSPLPRCR